MIRRVQDSRKYLPVAYPSIIDGIAANMDLYGVYNAYNTVENTKVADSNAIYNDFCAVGQDIMTSIAHYEQEAESS